MKRLAYRLQKCQVFPPHVQKQRIFKREDPQQSQVESNKQDSPDVPISSNWGVDKSADQVSQEALVSCFSERDFTHNYFKIFWSPFVSDSGSSMMGFPRQPISTILCHITWMQLLGHEGLGVCIDAAARNEHALAWYRCQARITFGRRNFETYYKHSTCQWRTLSGIGP